MMELNERHIKLFDQYLEGGLSKNMRLALEKKCLEDPAFKEAFQLHQEVRKGINKHGAMTLKKDLQELEAGFKDYSSYSPKKGISSSLIITGVVLILIFAAGIYWWMNRTLETNPTQPEPKEIFEERNNPLEIETNDDSGDTIPIHTSTESIKTPAKENESSAIGKEGIDEFDDHRKAQEANSEPQEKEDWSFFEPTQTDTTADIHNLHAVQLINPITGLPYNQTQVDSVMEELRSDPNIDSNQIILEQDTLY